MSPSFFEQLVLDLMLRMGYGGTQDTAGSLTAAGSDEGIDGVINEDQLGLDIVYLQAKRWENQVGRPETQKFVGALHGKIKMLGRLSQLNSELCTQIRTLPRTLRELDCKSAVQGTYAAASRQVSRLQTLGRAGASEVQERWRNADKKKLAKKLACSLAIKVVLAQVPVPSGIFSALDVFDA